MKLIDENSPNLFELLTKRNLEINNLHGKNSNLFHHKAAKLNHAKLHDTAFYNQEF